MSPPCDGTNRQKCLQCLYRPQSLSERRQREPLPQDEGQYAPILASVRANSAGKAGTTGKLSTRHPNQPRRPPQDRVSAWPDKPGGVALAAGAQIVCHWGTRGETGRRWCQRIWAVLATCAQHGRSSFEFLYDSIVAYFSKQPSPSLLPQPP